jgi:hypothetical protein
LRPDRLGKGEARAETFRRNPVGSQSHLVESANSQKRVLHRGGATPRTKRRQRGRRPCYRAPKSSFSQRAHRLNERRGRAPVPQGPGAGGLPGSKNTANAQEGSPATGETCRPPSSATAAQGVPHPKLLACRACVWARWERTARRKGGITGRAQESGETGWQGSEPFIVPVKSGNAALRGPGRGKGGPGHGAAVGPQGEDTEPQPLVHVTAADSTAGRQTRDLTSRMP